MELPQAIFWEKYAKFWEQQVEYCKRLEEQQAERIWRLEEFNKNATAEAKAKTWSWLHRKQTSGHKDQECHNLVDQGSRSPYKDSDICNKMVQVSLPTSDVNSFKDCEILFEASTKDNYFETNPELGRKFVKHAKLMIQVS